MDKTVRSWSLEGEREGEKKDGDCCIARRPLETIYNHLDYVQSLAVDSGQNWVASGGRWVLVSKYAIAGKFGCVIAHSTAFSCFWTQIHATRQTVIINALI